jgi:hypothetical protein
MIRTVTSFKSKNRKREDKRENNEREKKHISRGTGSMVVVGIGARVLFDSLK